MEILKLMKLLYLVDRAALAKYGFSVTGDKMVSMPHGPVLSQTLDLMNGAGASVHDGWDSKIMDRAGRRIALRDGVSVDRESLDEISDAELDLMESVFREYGEKSSWDLREYTHNHCSEWQDPCGSSVPIAYESIFKAFGRENELAASLASHLRADDRIDRVFLEL
ncbi:Panacea domain-containing protein [Xanthomonas phaseoli]|nr:Panacea domain-containing protein [Xanthomonas phaseoli]